MPPRPTRITAFDKGTTPVLTVLGAAAILLAGFWWFTGRPEPVAVSADRGPAVVPAGAVTPPIANPSIGSPTPSTAVPPAVASSAGATVTVDVRGRVHSPGIRSLPAGSRVMDAVAAAGGKTAGSHYGPLNLARILTDGEQIRVGVSAADSDTPSAATEPGVGPSTPTGGLINLNSASAVELEEVDGVGPVLAAAIVQWRTDNGPFQSVDELLDVSGIGEATLAGMRPQVTVG